MQCGQRDLLFLDAFHEFLSVLGAPGANSRVWDQNPQRIGFAKLFTFEIEEPKWWNYSGFQFAFRRLPNLSEKNLQLFWRSGRHFDLPSTTYQLWIVLLPLRTVVDGLSRRNGIQVTNFESGKVMATKGRRCRTRNRTRSWIWKGRSGTNWITRRRNQRRRKPRTWWNHVSLRKRFRRDTKNRSKRSAITRNWKSWRIRRIIRK
jgi:hypothetical protein